MDEVVLSLSVHQSPRRLKIGKAIGDSVAALGRSILPGCKRATQLARTYTIKMAKALADKFPESTLYQHVDDMTVVIKSKTRSAWQRWLQRPLRVLDVAVSLSHQSSERYL